MRIAIPTDDGNIVAGHTGRCRTFTIYDILDGEAKHLEIRGNTFTAHAKGQHKEGQHEHHHHANHQAHQHSHSTLLNALSDCEAMVALGMGPRLVNDLNARGIKVLFTRDVNIPNIVNALANGSFEENPNGSSCNRGSH